MPEPLRRKPGRPKKGTPRDPAVKESCRQVYELRKFGHAWDDIAKILGMKRRKAEDQFLQAIQKDGLPPFESPDGNVGNNIFEKTNPEAAGEVMAIDALEMDKDSRKAELREAMKKYGLPPTIINGFVKRLRTVFAPISNEAKRLTNQEMLVQLESKIALTLHYLDEAGVSQASYKDLSVALGLMIDRHQLLSGKPTMIIDQNTRLQLNEALPKLMAEMNRRGITIDGQSKVIDVTPHG